MKNKLIYVVVFVFFLAAIIILVSCGNPAGGGSGTYTVRYVISGPQVIADVINYTNETGNLESIYNIPIPWEKTIIVQSKRAVSCRAIYSNLNNFTYTAKIFVNGKEIATASSSSSSVTATGLTQ